jgi:hypothetical protein
LSGVGRKEGIWVINGTAIDFSSGDETYRLHLLGSNDVAFGNGNVDLLAFQDFAAASAGRIIATLLGASLAAPSVCYVPFVNLKQKLLYRYARCRLVAGGATPSITLSTWLSVGLCPIRVAAVAGVLLQQDTEVLARALLLWAVRLIAAAKKALVLALSISQRSAYRTPGCRCMVGQ